MSSSQVGEFLLKGGCISGESLARSIGISRVAVFKRITYLRGLGYDIESIRGKGYFLRPRFDGLLPLEIRSKLMTTVFGNEVHCHEMLDSTQSCLKELADSGAPEGTLVLALEQKSGRGRSGRSWSSPKGGLWFSLLLRPKMPAREIYKLSLLFGVSVKRALSINGLDALLKWPNDVLVGGRKICGTLLETSAEPDRINYVAVGVGVNVNFSMQDLPVELRSKSVSVLDIIHRKADRAGLLGEILRDAEFRYEQACRNGFAGVIDEWKVSSCTIGKRVVVRSYDSELRGKAVDIDEDGSLVLETEMGRKKVFSGEVFFDTRI